ncbi:MAG TPA: hypothetical protein V6C65_41695 [Allocoleopsis sp.]
MSIWRVKRITPPFIQYAFPTGSPVQALKLRIEKHGGLFTVCIGCFSISISRGIPFLSVVRMETECSQLCSIKLHHQ